MQVRVLEMKVLGSDIEEQWGLNGVGVWRVCLLGLELPSCSLLLSSLLSLVALQHWCQGGAPSHRLPCFTWSFGSQFTVIQLKTPFSCLLYFLWWKYKEGVFIWEWRRLWWLCYCWKFSWDWTSLLILYIFEPWLASTVEAVQYQWDCELTGRMSVVHFLVGCTRYSS